MEADNQSQVFRRERPVKQFGFVSTIVVLCGAMALLALATRAAAQVATPASESSPGAETLILIEHNDNIFIDDQSPAGPSAGDWQVWGPNPLFDETNTTDTGATTQGTCFTLASAPDCYANETIVFPDGSTLEIQGVERTGVESARTIVGGSGRYLGATGTVRVEPTSDESEWTKTIEIVMPMES